MKELFKLSFAIVLCASFLSSCKKDMKQDVTPQVSQSVIDKVHQLGFSTQNIAVHEDGYLVEGDIVITDRELNAVPESKFLRVGEVEQYRTFNLVTALPRTITVSLNGFLPASYGAALDDALSRYNALGLSLTFQRVSSGADISIVRGLGGVASAGFPSNGKPYSQIKVSPFGIGNEPQDVIATILAHEIGHCIGFRHTDYMDRSFSCGGQKVNEGASSVGAEHIEGTPTGPDPNSWMLSCYSSGQNRPFNANDETALRYLY